MDRSDTQSKTFRRHYESAVPEPSFPGHDFEVPKHTSFQHMVPVECADLSSFGSIGNECFSWGSEDSGKYFACHAGEPQDDAQLSPLATSAGRSGVQWIAPVPIHEKEYGNGRSGVEGWPQYPKPESCNALALRTLKILHVATEECLSRSENETFQMSRRDAIAGARQGRSARSMDAVLPQIEEALAATTTIVRCSCSCFLKIQLQLLVANVLEKLVSWCGAVIRSMSTNTGNHDRGRREQVSRQSITIGSHHLDDSLEVQVMGQIVTDKIHKLEGLVEELARRTEGANMGRHGHMFTEVSLREAGLLKVIRDRLSDYLRGQIGLLRRDSTRLRAGNSAV